MSASAQQVKALVQHLMWCAARAYGELRWCMNGGACAGYYWALRFCCNVCRKDWYGRPTTPVFNFVGRPRW